MTRRAPVDFAGAFVHAYARGANGMDVYRDGIDYAAWLRMFERTVGRFAWTCHAYCLMPNHFHVLLELARPTLATGMRDLNGSYAQRFNLRYERFGHVFGGPYRTTLVETDPHLLEVCRYIVLNPVRAGLCDDPADWPWSSYRATAGLDHCPPYLTVDLVRSLFGTGFAALREYRRFVAAGDMSRDLVAGHDVSGQ